MQLETPLKRFLLFSGDNYYPGGGWVDFQGSFDTLEEAKAAYEPEFGLANNERTWFHIVDLATGQAVE